MDRNMALVVLAVALQGMTGSAQQPVPSTTTAAQAVPSGRTRKGARELKIKLGPAKASVTVKNPRAAQADSAIIAVLAKQKQAAQLEASQMIRTGAHPAALLAGPSQPASARGGTTAKAPVPATTTIQKASAPGMIAPGKVSDSPGNSGLSGRTAQPASIALTCTHDPTMRILAVSGDSSAATFTSDENYNFYTITGCSFGDPGTNSKVYIYYKDTFHQEFTVQEWNENGIKLNLHPSLRGLLDQDNLTLVVQRNDGKQATKGGFKFYAARETQRLTFFPQDQFSLWHFTLNDTSHLVPQYASPSSVGTPDGGQPGIPGYAAEVYWTCTNCFAKKGRFDNVYMQGNEDVWQLRNLQPGFVVESYGMGHRDLQCGDYQLDTEGAFGLKLVGNELHAQWQGQTCVADGCGGFGQADCFGGSGSDYLININVTGPRGVDPWTGKVL